MAKESIPASILTPTLDAGAVRMWTRVKWLSEADIYDRLTRLYNARHLAIAFHMEHSRAKRFARPLSVVLIDIDDLEGINRRLDRTGGTRALIEIADIVRTRPRDYDLVFRLDDDDFLILLPETDRAGATRVAGDLVAAVAGTAIAGQTPGAITVTGGFAQVRADDKTEGLRSVLERAQAGQAQARADGGNKTFEF